MYRFSDPLRDRRRSTRVRRGRRGRTAITEIKGEGGNRCVTRGENNTPPTRHGRTVPSCRALYLLLTVSCYCTRVGESMGRSPLNSVGQRQQTIYDPNKIKVELNSYCLRKKHYFTLHASRVQYSLTYRVKISIPKLSNNNFYFIFFYSFYYCF